MLELFDNPPEIYLSNTVSVMRDESGSLFLLLDIDGMQTNYLAARAREIDLLAFIRGEADLLTFFTIISKNVYRITDSDGVEACEEISAEATEELFAQAEVSSKPYVLTDDDVRSYADTLSRYAAADIIGGIDLLNPADAAEIFEQLYRRPVVLAHCGKKGSSSQQDTQDEQKSTLLSQIAKAAEIISRDEFSELISDVAGDLPIEIIDDMRTRARYMSKKELIEFYSAML